MSVAKDILLDGTVLSCPIDYPLGMEDIKVRNYAVLNAIRKGVNAIDLVINSNLIINDKIDILIDDLQSNFYICQDHNATLRVMLEYKLLDNSTCIKVATLLNFIGITYAFPSTGHIMDDIIDNYCIGREIQEQSNINIILNATAESKPKYDVVQKHDNIFGVRIKSMSVLHTIFGPKVYN